MRRHLRNLLAAGLLLRRDSSNGKRYALRGDNAQVAFGFDLSPLLEKAGDIFRAASEADETEQKIRNARRRLALMRRDLFALLPLLSAETSAQTEAWWDTTTRVLRRKLSCQALEEICAEHESLLAILKTSLLTSSDSQNEQHIHNSNIKYLESEASKTPDPIGTVASVETLPLDLVLKACPDLAVFNGSPIRSSDELINLTRKIYRSLGITDQCYDEARRYLGLEQTAIVIAALLQRFAHIRSPSAYLRSLIRKAAEGKFSCRPMIMALITTSTRQLNSC